jgi:hypothetical protein
MQPRGASWDTCRDPVRITLATLSVVLSSSIGFGQTLPPVRGVYPLGMNALNSGVTPEPGFTYSNLFVFYSRNQFKGADGWVSTFSSGQTCYLTREKRTSFSAFEMYKIHSTQKDTQIHPGQTLNLDYSLTQDIPLYNDNRLQIGLVGYEQWQTTDTTGPIVTPEQASAHYRVTALGLGSSLTLPARKVSLSFKYFREFSNKSTFQGNSVQISTAISF